jgi:uncharacterized membrane protein HdeD (DUF308 family)
MEKRKKQLFTGIIIIIVSIFVLYFNLKMFEGSFGKLWPAILLLVGVVFYIAYFSTRKRKNRIGLGFLATFVSVSSIPLFIMNFTDSSTFRYLWPGFLVALGCGLLTVHFYGNKRKGTLFLAQLLIALPILIWIIFAMRSKFGLVIGVVLLMTGVTFLARGLIRETAASIRVEQRGEDEDGEFNPEDAGV